MFVWLHSYWGAVVAVITILGGLIGLAEYLERKIEQHEPLRAWIVRWLVVPSFYDSYRDWLGGRLEGLRNWMGGLWSWTALMRCLAIAVGYPVAMLLFSYGLGGSGAIGSTEFLPRLEGWRQLAVGFGLLGAAIVFGLTLVFSGRIDALLQGWIAARLEGRDVENRRRAAWLYRIGIGTATSSLWLAAGFFAGLPTAVAFALAVAGAFAVAGALAGAGAFAGVVGLAGAGILTVAGALAATGAIAFAILGALGAIALALAGGGAFPVAEAFAVAGALAAIGALALAVAVAVEVARPGAIAFAIAGTGAVAVAMMWLRGVSPVSLGLLLFLVILPLANAVLDWWSWAISRWLGHDIHDLMHNRRRWLGGLVRWLSGRVWKPTAFVVHVALDICAAVVLLAALAILLPFVIEVFNNAVKASGSEAPLALNDFLVRAAARPWPDGVWALSMLLTTLVPTAVHAAAVIVTLFLWFVQPTAWRKRIESGLQAQSSDERAWAVTKASWLVVLTPLVAALVVVALGWAVTRLIGLVEPVAELLFEAAQFGVGRADDFAHALGWLALQR